MKEFKKFIRSLVYYKLAKNQRANYQHRHCVRSEAIHETKSMDCFMPHNDAINFQQINSIHSKKTAPRKFILGAVF